MRGAPQSKFCTLVCRISARSSISVCGRPPHESASAGLYPGHSLADLTISTSGSKFRQAQPVLADRVEYGHSTRPLRHLTPAPLWESKKASRKPGAPRGTATDEVAWES